MSTLNQHAERRALVLLAGIFAGEAGIPGGVLELSHLIDVAMDRGETNRLADIFTDTVADEDLWADAWNIAMQARGTVS